MVIEAESEMSQKEKENYTKKRIKKLQQELKSWTKSKAIVI